MNIPNWENLRRNVWEMLLRRWLAAHPELTPEQQQWVEAVRSTLTMHGPEIPLMARVETNARLNAAMSQLLRS
jgi:hypothetical protein